MVVNDPYQGRGTPLRGELVGLCHDFQMALMEISSISLNAAACMQQYELMQSFTSSMHSIA